MFLTPSHLIFSECWIRSYSSIILIIIFFFVSLFLVCSTNRCFKIMQYYSLVLSSYSYIQCFLPVQTFLVACNSLVIQSKWHGYSARIIRVPVPVPIHIGITYTVLVRVR